MTTLIQSTRRDGVMVKGEWRGTDGAVVVGCPGCGKICTLSAHTIDPDGKVYPSLDCPFGHCDFDDFVRLADWTA